MSAVEDAVVALCHSLLLHLYAASLALRQVVCRGARFLRRDSVNRELRASGSAAML